MTALARARATASSAALVIAVLAVGRFVADHVNSDIDPAPFYREVAAGGTAHLRLADVTVDRAQVADNIVVLRDAYKAQGVFLVVDVTLTGLSRPGLLGGIMLQGADGTLYEPDSSRTSCTGVLAVESRVKTYGRFCFDVPPAVVDDVRLEVSVADPEEMGGNGQRRDDVALFDLGITPAEAKRMIDADLTLASANDPFVKPDPEPKPAPLVTGDAS